MPLITPGVGDTTYANSINQLVNVLQQPPGGQEVRRYHISGNSYAVGVFLTTYVLSRSRGTVPVSATIDTSGAALLNLNKPVANNLTSAGVQVYATSTAVSTVCIVGGNLTYQY